MTDRKYTPVDCGFVDVVEHLATLRQELTIVFVVKGLQHSVQSTIKTWENHKGIEYLVLKECELWIRLDRIVSLGDYKAADYAVSCGLPDS